MLFDGRLAALTLDVAAPLELAAALLGDRTSHFVVAASAAHLIASVRRTRCRRRRSTSRRRRRRERRVAPPTGRPRPAGLLVAVAEVRRRLDVDEVGGRDDRRRIDGDADGDDGSETRNGTGVDVRHLDGRVVLVAEVRADVTQRRGRLPAGLHVARAGDAVALAPHLGIIGQHLRAAETDHQI